MLSLTTSLYYHYTIFMSTLFLKINSFIFLNNLKYPINHYISINSSKFNTIYFRYFFTNKILNLAHVVFLLGERPVKILDKVKENNIKNIIDKII